MRVVSAAAAVADAERLMEVAGGVLGDGEARRLRFDVALKNLDEDVHGSYGEFPLTGLLSLLEHPAVAEVLAAAEKGDIVAGAEGSVDDAEKAAFFKDSDSCDDPGYPEKTANPFQPSLVDIGSGAGRLVLAAATMRAWGSVVGIEACKTLAGLGKAAIAKLESEGVAAEGVMRSIHADANLGGGAVARVVDASCAADPAGDGGGGRLVEAASALAGADIAIAYSTAFPSPDGLRLPELSAALSAVMRPGSLVVTTDKWLVGRRFEFVDMLRIQGEEGPEDVIRAFVWRVKGEVPVSYVSDSGANTQEVPPGAGAGEEKSLAGLKVVAQELEEIQREWMDDEDACSQNSEACAAMLLSLEEELSVQQGIEDADEAGRGDNDDSAVEIFS